MSPLGPLRAPPRARQSGRVTSRAVVVHELSRRDARRIAVRAQLLDAARPTDLLDTVRHLTMLQLDPIAAVAPSADLVAWSRLGSTYRPADLVAAVESRDLIELDARLRPAEDFALYRAEMAQWPGQERLRDWHRANQRWLAANDACRRDILDRLTRSGPLPSRELPDTCVGPVVLDPLDQRQEHHPAARVPGRLRRGRRRRAGGPRPALGPGRAGLSRRPRGTRRGGSPPPQRTPPPALGLARSRGPVYPGEPADVGEVGEPAVIEAYAVSGGSIPLSWGSRSPGGWRCCPRSTGWSTTGSGPWRSSGSSTSWRCTSRSRKRRCGYFALPILSGDALVGKLDATADLKAGVLRVDAIHQDVPFDGEHRR